MLTSVCIFRAHLYAVSGYSAVCVEYVCVCLRDTKTKCKTEKVSVHVGTLARVCDILLMSTSGGTEQWARN